MPSTFTWLDYSEHERRKMLDVIELFGEKSTRDELGLGGVRDAFADLLFPGTSTIQTVAKYFLFVPWIYQKLESKQTPSSKMSLRARKLEIELARQLEEMGESDGVIGRIAKEKLQRLPSNIYWQGMKKWGICTFSGSQEEYHRRADLFYKQQNARRASSNEHKGESADEADLHNWHIGLPQPNDEFPNGSNLTLSTDEAEYLRERLLTNCADSLMAYLVRERIDVDLAPFAWDLTDELPNNLRTQLDHGRNFSETVYGAQLLYNLILAEKQSWQEKTDSYREDLNDWWQMISNRMTVLRTWDRREFWRIVLQSNPRVSLRARSFIRSWIDLVINATDLSTIVDSELARQLVEHREIQLKKGLARVRNERARELWSGAAGSVQFDLRWRSARRIMADILAGLEVESNA